MTTKRNDQAQEQPSRLLSRPSGGDAAEDRLAALMRRAATPPEGLGAAARERVWRRLDRREQRAQPSASLRWSVAVGVLLTSGVVVAAVSAPRWWPLLRAPHVESAPANTPASPRARAPRVAVAAPAAAPAEAMPADTTGIAPEVVPALPAAAEALPASSPVEPKLVVANRAVPRANVSASAPRETTPPDLAPPELPVGSAARGHQAMDHVRVPAEAIPAPPAPSALANETTLLSAALTRLRQHRDAAGALAALDVYDASAPHGTLRREADGARVDALLMLGREADALAVLRTLRLQPRGRDQELRVVRGELAAPISCAAAVDDFDRVLSGAPPPPLAERALYGRATCLARLGDVTAAQHDLREYLRRFPAGRFAPEVRRLSEANDL